MELGIATTDAATRTSTNRDDSAPRREEDDRQQLSRLEKACADDVTLANVPTTDTRNDVARSDAKGMTDPTGHRGVDLEEGTDRGNQPLTSSDIKRSPSSSGALVSLRKLVAQAKDKDGDGADLGLTDRNVRTVSKSQKNQSLRSSNDSRQSSRAFRIRCLRYCLAIVLVCSAVAVSVAVFFYTSRSEQEKFTSQFRSDAQKLLNGVGTNFVLTMSAADAFMLRVVAHARATNASWPFVAPLPDLAVQSTKLLSTVSMQGPS